MNAAERLHLKWNDHSHSILQAFLNYFITDRMVDVTLSCRGQFIKAHKVILSASSAYFEEVFKAHHENNVVVVINSVSIQQLLLIIEYIYTGEVDVSEHELRDFLQIAEELQIKSLHDVLAKIHFKQPLEVLAQFVNSDAGDTEDASNATTSMNINSNKESVLYQKPALSTPLRKTSDYKSDNEENNNTLITSNGQDDIARKSQNTPKKPPKIRRPPNAFMVFANQWRRKLANEHKEENNKEISIRLGLMWKNMNDEEKVKYYEESRKADEEHKLKYPGYYYSPIEARKRKQRKNERNLNQNFSSDAESPPKVERFCNKNSLHVNELNESTESAEEIKVEPELNYEPELSDVIDAVIGRGITKCIIENNNIVTRAKIEPAAFIKKEIILESPSRE